MLLCTALALGTLRTWRLECLSDWVSFHVAHRWPGSLIGRGPEHLPGDTDAATTQGPQHSLLSFSRSIPSLHPFSSTWTEI